MAARVLETLVGVCLLAAPELAGYDGPARINHLVVGPIAASVAVMAMSQVLRELRWLNAVLGAWLVVSPVVLPHDRTAVAVGVTSGMLLALLSLVRGRAEHRLGGGWRAAFRPVRQGAMEDEGGEA